LAVQADELRLSNKWVGVRPGAPLTANRDNHRRSTRTFRYASIPTV